MLEGYASNVVILKTMVLVVVLVGHRRRIGRNPKEFQIREYAAIKIEGMLKMLEEIIQKHQEQVELLRSVCAPFDPAELCELVTEADEETNDTEVEKSD